MISALFVARDSVYKTFPGVDCWDEDRNALNWPGGNPAVFHPPCRLFSMLRLFSTAPESEKQLAYWSVEQVRKWGGVLEHPACSLLWDDMDLPLPGKRDDFGLTIALNQWWFGHLARKSTWLYICGAKTLPEIPLRLGEAECALGKGRDKLRTREFDNRKKLRLGTPIAFAKWLIEVAKFAQTEMSYA